MGHFRCGIAFQTMSVSGILPADHELEARGTHRLEADATMTAILPLNFLLPDRG